MQNDDSEFFICAASEYQSAYLPTRLSGRFALIWFWDGPDWLCPLPRLRRDLHVDLANATVFDWRVRAESDSLDLVAHVRPSEPLTR